MTSWRVMLCAALIAALSSEVNAATWVGTWGAAPLPPTTAAGPRPGTPSFSNQTIRQFVRISAGGKRVRVRFTNEYGTKPLAALSQRSRQRRQAYAVCASLTARWRRLQGEGGLGRPMLRDASTQVN